LRLGRDEGGIERTKASGQNFVERKNRDDKEKMTKGHRFSKVKKL